MNAGDTNKRILSLSLNQPLEIMVLLLEATKLQGILSLQWMLEALQRVTLAPVLRLDSMSVCWRGGAAKAVNVTRHEPGLDLAVIHASRWSQVVRFWRELLQ